MTARGAHRPIHANTKTYKHAYIFTHARVHTHTHTHTHTPAVAKGALLDVVRLDDALDELRRRHEL